MSAGPLPPDTSLRRAVLSKTGLQSMKRCERGRVTAGALAALLALTLGGLGPGCHASGSSSTVSSLIGPAGGTVTASDGSSVEIPAGALSSATTITMAAVEASALPPGGGSGGAAYALGPETLTFAVPVTMRLRFDAAALPPKTLGTDLAIFTTSVGTTDHAYWLATRVADATYVSAQTTHFSWVWVADPRPFASQAGPPPTNCGIGGAACIDFDVDEQGFCALCQCSDGSECPGGDPTQCCACANGAACPENASRLCSLCDAGSLAAIVLGVPTQSVGPNCTLDSDLCFACPAPTPVACSSGLCCPADHSACCGDGRSCGATAEACVAADAGATDDGADGEAGE